MEHNINTLSMEESTKKTIDYSLYFEKSDF